MGTQELVEAAHPSGELPGVEGTISEAPVVLDTFDGRVHVIWEPEASVTPLGQFAFFADFLKLGGRFDAWVADCPLTFTSPNAPKIRDVLGTVVISALAGHRRYAHISGLRGDGVNPGLLGMSKVASEDSVRRTLAKMDEAAGVSWMQAHLDHCSLPILQEPWILDLDVTVKPLYGNQEGAEIGYNPKKPGRPSHTYHTFLVGGLRLVAFWKSRLPCG